MAPAALTSVVWGLGFVAIKRGLESFSAPVRFLIACLPVLRAPAARRARRRPDRLAQGE
jgi:hypothetical protein